VSFRCRHTLQVGHRAALLGLCRAPIFYSYTHDQADRLALDSTLKESRKLVCPGAPPQMHQGLCFPGVHPPCQNILRPASRAVRRPPAVSPLVSVPCCLPASCPVMKLYEHAPLGFVAVHGNLPLRLFPPDGGSTSACPTAISCLHLAARPSPPQFITVSSGSIVGLTLASSYRIAPPFGHRSRALAASQCACHATLRGGREGLQPIDGHQLFASLPELFRRLHLLQILGVDLFVGGCFHDPFVFGDGVGGDALVGIDGEHFFDERLGLRRYVVPPRRRKVVPPLRIWSKSAGSSSS